MLLAVGSLVLGLGNVLAMIGVSRHPKRSYALGIVLQVPWTAYDILTHQYGFLIITAVAVPAYVRKLMSHSSTGRASGC